MHIISDTEKNEIESESESVSEGDEYDDNKEYQIQSDVAEECIHSLRNSILTKVKCLNHQNVQDYYEIVETLLPIDCQDWSPLKEQINEALKEENCSRIYVKALRGQLNNFKSRKNGNIKIIAYITSLERYRVRNGFFGSISEKFEDPL